jgi:hypothetical protein
MRGWPDSASKADWFLNLRDQVLAAVKRRSILPSAVLWASSGSSGFRFCCATYSPGTSGFQPPAGCARDLPPPPPPTLHANEIISPGLGLGTEAPLTGQLVSRLALNLATPTTATVRPLRHRPPPPDLRDLAAIGCHYLSSSPRPIITSTTLETSIRKPLS